MRIEAGLAIRQRPPSEAVAPDGPASFAAIMAFATATGNAAQAGAAPDFTSMTRKDLFDWMNSRIGSGEMSLEDGAAFLGMTVRIPVGAAQGAPLALDDQERVDFVRTARDGIAGALARNDAAARERLETALRIMRGQGSAAGRFA